MADEGRGQGVHGDAVLALFHRQTRCEMCDSRLGRAINRFGRQRREGSLRAHVDDGAALLADHQAACGLAGKKCDLQVHGQCGVKIFFSYVLSQIFGGDTGIVHQDVDAAEALPTALVRYTLTPDNYWRMVTTAAHAPRPVPMAAPVML